MSWQFTGLLLVVGLWVGYVVLSSRSAELGIEHDPFKKPVFYAILATTIIIVFGVVSSILNPWLEGLK